MLEREQHTLPVDELFVDEQIGGFVRSINIDSPYQQLLFEGVSTKSVKKIADEWFLLLCFWESNFQPS